MTPEARYVRTSASASAANVPPLPSPRNEDARCSTRTAGPFGQSGIGSSLSFLNPDGLPDASSDAANRAREQMAAPPVGSALPLRRNFRPPVPGLTLPFIDLMAAASARASGS